MLQGPFTCKGIALPPKGVTVHVCGTVTNCAEAVQANRKSQKNEVKKDGKRGRLSRAMRALAAERGRLSQTIGERLKYIDQSA